MSDLLFFKEMLKDLVLGLLFLTVIYEYKKKVDKTERKEHHKKTHSLLHST